MNKNNTGVFVCKNINKKIIEDNINNIRFAYTIQIYDVHFIVENITNIIKILMEDNSNSPCKEITEKFFKLVPELKNIKSFEKLFEEIYRKIDNSKPSLEDLD